MPLPLAPFEYYMLADDRPDYPMTMCARTRYTGVFDRPSLARAVKRAILRHPLLHATIREAGRGRLEWVDEPHPEPLITWGRLDAPYDFPRGRHIDLRREIGVRVAIREDGEQSEMLLQISHVCCDGLGLLQFLEDLLLAYHAERCPEAKVELRAVDLNRIHERGKFGLTPLGLLRRLHLELLGLLGAFEFLLHRPIPVAIPAPEDNESTACTGEFPAMFTHCFDAEEVKALRNVAKQDEEVTLNDVLVRDLFLALAEWTELHEPANRGGVLRVMVPVNLREEGDKTSPASNIMSMVNLDRRATKFGTPQKLLQGLAWEMRLIRKYRLGLTLIHLTRLIKKVGLNLSTLLPANRCLATTVISNVARFPSGAALPRRDGRTIAGDVAMESLDGLVVFRPFTRATFLVSFYRGAMSLTMSYDATTLSADAARQLFDVVLSRIRRTANRSVPAENLVHAS